VRPGRIRLYGDFVGTVTTEDHYLEVALPLNCELPIAAFETVIAAIVAEHASRRNGDAQSELEQRTGKVWEDLKVILTSSSSSPSGAGVGKMHTSSEDTIMPSASQTNFFKKIISEEDMDALWRAASHEKALEIDYAAKEALVLELRKERDGLKQELERLREPQLFLVPAADSSPHHEHLQRFEQQASTQSFVVQFARCWTGQGVYGCKLGAIITNTFSATWRKGIWFL